MKRIISLITLMLLILNLSGCSKSNNENIVDKNQDVISQSNNQQYPVTITTYDYEGNEIKTTYEKAPEKVLAVYQGSIETMLALGLEDKMVAAAGLDNEVDDSMKEAFEKVEYLTEFTPSKETVTMLQPDMILSWGSIFAEDKLGDVNTWIEKGTNTYINTNTRFNGNRTLENEYNDILNLGKIFNVEEKAEALVNEMKAEIEKVEEKAKLQDKKTSALVIEFSGDKSIINYGASSLAGDMVQSLGAKLASEDSKNLGKEDIISLNPDVIFVVYMPYSGDNTEEVKQSNLDYILKDSAFKNLDAVKNNKVVPIMLGDMYASGVRTKDGIVNFSKGLYPEI